MIDELLRFVRFTPTPHTRPPDHPAAGPAATAAPRTVHSVMRKCGYHSGLWYIYSTGFINKCGNWHRYTLEFTASYTYRTSTYRRRTGPSGQASTTRTTYVQSPHESHVSRLRTRRQRLSQLSRVLDQTQLPYDAAAFAHTDTEAISELY